MSRRIGRASWPRRGQKVRLQATCSPARPCPGLLDEQPRKTGPARPFTPWPTRLATPVSFWLERGIGWRKVPVAGGKPQALDARDLGWTARGRPSYAPPMSVSKALSLRLWTGLAPTLTTQEKRELDRAERKIAAGLKSFLEVGLALKEIGRVAGFYPA
jgi:hypothetical protein